MNEELNTAPKLQNSPRDFCLLLFILYFYKHMKIHPDSYSGFSLSSQGLRTCLK